MSKGKFRVEKTFFGVCQRLGEKMGISSHRIRLYFIYVSFFTFGSPIIIYFIMAFWMNVKNYLREKRKAIWDF